MRLGPSKSASESPCHPVIRALAVALYGENKYRKALKQYDAVQLHNK